MILQFCWDILVSSKLVQEAGHEIDKRKNKQDVIHDNYNAIWREKDRTAQHTAWDRITEWLVDEEDSCLLLCTIACKPCSPAQCKKLDNALVFYLFCQLELLNYKFCNINYYPIWKCFNFQLSYKTYLLFQCEGWCWSIFSLCFLGDSACCLIVPQNADLQAGWATLL